jgi:hypothetical protein
MATDFFVIVLLVASLAALVFVWVRLRQLERRLEAGAKGVAEVDRVVRSECLPAVTEGARRVATVLERLDAVTGAAQADAARSREGLAPVLDEIAKASAELAAVKVELARLIERSGSRPAEEQARSADGAWVRELVRTHLLGLGVGAVSIDGVVSRPDGAQVVRARGTRGAELWNGNVVVRGGKVESASAVAARMFP